ncbi:hypothetical protein Q8A64_04200 [Oxalobacteraceae bacterium R-40]|uniref:Uncharacterized protein n=1 Tax=Keguizhuia sedimenti TaxID=3064264 RepID=A0ABU1BKU9_9BURK|nr:hypothetical protein [Oxalobacteraceae bacterium R-40]
MTQPDRQTSRRLFINELEWRFVAGLAGFALPCMLDQMVHLFIRWYVGSGSSLAAASHPLHAPGELSRVVCGPLAMTVVLIALTGIRLPGRGGRHDVEK